MQAQRKPQYTPTAQAFFKALDDKRLNFHEIAYYKYVGRVLGKDMFINVRTGLYLD